MNSMKSRINEFLNGGESNAALYGRIFGRGITWCLKWGSVSCIGLVLIALGQFSQIMASSKDVREDAISSWIAAHPDQEEVAVQFREECLDGKPINRTMETTIIGVYECGVLIGADSLVDFIKEADSSLVSVSWPLALID